MIAVRIRLNLLILSGFSVHENRFVSRFYLPAARSHCGLCQPNVCTANVSVRRTTFRHYRIGGGAFDRQREEAEIIVRRGPSSDTPQSIPTQAVVVRAAAD